MASKDARGGADQPVEGPRDAPGPEDISTSSGLRATGRLEDSLVLVERLRAGDREALNALVDRYYDRVRRIARIRIGPRLARRTESEDLVQETFAVAFTKIGELELENHSSIIRYLSRVLENQIRGAVDYFAAQKRQPAGGELVSAEETAVRRELSAAPGREHDPLDQAALQELKACYDTAVEELRPHYREAILLREYADASWGELRDALECPTEHAARQLYARAQLALAARLRVRLGDLGRDGELEADGSR